MNSAHLCSRFLNRLLVLSVFAGCHVSYAQAENSPQPKAIKFEFEITPERLLAIEQGVKQLKKGDPLEKAIKILGAPSTDENIYRKRTLGGGQFVARCLTYNVKLVQLSSGNIYDHKILLYFDKIGRLAAAERVGFSQSKSKALMKFGAPIVEKIL